MALIVVLIVAAVAFSVGAPTIAMGWINQITGTQNNCEIDPYNTLCVCNADERKIDVPWLGLPKFDCEVVQNLIIDPESPTFEDDAISYAQSYLSNNCGICGDLSCGNPCGILIDGQWVPSANPIYPEDRCISAVFGYGAEGERVVNIECVVVDEWGPQNQALSGYILWRMNFFVESETMIPNTYPNMDNYCLNDEQTQRCTYQEYCDMAGGAEWCVPDLPMEVVSTPLLSIMPNIGSGLPSGM